VSEPRDYRPISLTQMLGQQTWGLGLECRNQPVGALPHPFMTVYPICFHDETGNRQSREDGRNPLAQALQ
jgi:hypothetical protein